MFLQFVYSQKFLRRGGGLRGAWACGVNLDILFCFLGEKMEDKGKNGRIIEQMKLMNERMYNIENLLEASVYHQRRIDFTSSMSRGNRDTAVSLTKILL